MPAAAVIQRVRALSGIIGRKAYVGGAISRGLNLHAQHEICSRNCCPIEVCRGKWNSVCRGKIRRYTEERQKRKQFAGHILTLRYESVGSKQD